MAISPIVPEAMLTAVMAFFSFCFVFIMFAVSMYVRKQPIHNNPISADKICVSLHIAEIIIYVIYTIKAFPS